MLAAGGGGVIRKRRYILKIRGLNHPVTTERIVQRDRQQLPQFQIFQHHAPGSSKRLSTPLRRSVNSFDGFATKSGKHIAPLQTPTSPGKSLPGAIRLIVMHLV